jgi:hypothetical protein
MQLRAVTRGRFRQLVSAATGATPSVALYNCTVDEPPYERGGKTYVSLDIEDAVGDVDLLREIDAFVDSAAKPAFSPLATASLLIVKVPAHGVRYDAEDGSRDLDGAFQLRRGQAVDVVVRPGAFGAFGYCFLLQRVKPHAVLVV